MSKKGLFFNSECRALIIGSTGAIGSAIVEILKNKIGSENVVTISRRKNGLDFMKPETIELRAKEQNGYFNFILDATGALEISNVGPEKSLRSLDHERMVNQFTVNAIGPAMLIKHFMKFLPRNGKAVFASLSARVGSVEDNQLGGWISYRASKAALNQIIKTASIEASRINPHSVFISIHPGTVRSKLTEQYLRNHKFVEPSEAARNILQVIEQKGSQDTGGFYAFDGKRIPY
ncbi:MAG: SDR family NAD(P)-dependent oxidoreductase [Paracoccaceae bacterium]|nr:SDR family NAD(P)-dependent oxidoreductase [Paracoccaceae bacterium]